MRDRLPLALQLYRVASLALASPVASRLLASRVKRGKENPSRLAERYGQASMPRPPGPLIWLHGASVGEMLAVIPLIERLRAKDFAVLVTSGTVTSAALAQQRLPAGVVHQFIPLDAPRFIDRFLNHWRPDLALFVESDFWPNLILACADRGISIILVNGRVSERSFSRWRLQPERDRRAAAAVRSLPGAIQGGCGSLRPTWRVAHQQHRQSQARRTCPAGGFADVAQIQIGHRCARGDRGGVDARGRRNRRPRRASAAAREIPSLLTIIAPRHPERGAGIAEAAKAAGFSVALRSRDDMPKPDNRYLRRRHAWRTGADLPAGARRIHGWLARQSRRPEPD